MKVEDHGPALFHHHDGMIGSFIASIIAYPGFEQVLTIITVRGRVILENGRITGRDTEGIDNPLRLPADSPAFRSNERCSARYRSA